MKLGSKLSVIPLCCLVSHICIIPALSERIPSYQGSSYGWVEPSYADRPTGLSPDYLGEPTGEDGPTGFGAGYFAGSTGTAGQAGQYPNFMGESIGGDGPIEMSPNYEEDMADPSGMAAHFVKGLTNGDGDTGPPMDYIGNVFDKAGQHQSIAAPLQMSTMPYNIFNYPHPTVAHPQRRTKSRQVIPSAKPLRPAKASKKSRTADQNLWGDMVSAIGTLAKNKTLELAQNNKLVNRKSRRHGKKRCTCRKKKGGRRMKSVPPTIPRSDLHKTHLSTLPMGQITSTPYVEQSTEPSVVSTTVEHVTTLQPTTTTTTMTTTERATTTRPPPTTVLVVTTTPTVVTTVAPTKPQDEIEENKTSLATDSPKAVKKRRKCKRRRKKLTRTISERKPDERDNDGVYVNDGSRHLLRMDFRNPARQEELTEAKSLESGDLALVMD